MDWIAVGAIAEIVGVPGAVNVGCLHRLDSGTTQRTKS